MADPLSPLDRLSPIVPPEGSPFENRPALGPIRPPPERDETDTRRRPPAPRSRPPAVLLVSVQYHAERLVCDRLASVSGRETRDVFLRYQDAQIGADLDAVARDGAGEALERLRDYFTSENTAQRIAGFAVAGFGRTPLGPVDTPETRRHYVDFVLPHVRKGVSAALAMFGDLPRDVRRAAEATYEAIGALLTRWAGVDSMDALPLDM